MISFSTTRGLNGSSISNLNSGYSNDSSAALIGSELTSPVYSNPKALAETNLRDTHKVTWN